MIDFAGVDLRAIGEPFSVDAGNDVIVSMNRDDCIILLNLDN